MTRRIIAIGGGDIKAHETLAIDEVNVSRVDKDHPNLLFVPTASMDNEDYAEAIKQVYGGMLGCSVDVAHLCSPNASHSKFSAQLAWADLIYVGGGNTKAMLARWRELGFDNALREFVASGKPVSGLSAGAICWFRVGNSDWPQYEEIPGMTTARLDCLGLVDLVVCPHTRREEFRLDDFTKMMETESGVGIGLDDGCAIQIEDDQYRIIASIAGSGAHRISRREGQLVRDFLEPHDDFRPLTELHTAAVG